jgi:hypothetical protein
MTWLAVLFNQGVGFSNPAWLFSPTMDYVRAHKETPIYTNAPDPVFLLVGTPAAMLPRHTDPGSRRDNPLYGSEMERIKKNGGIVVYFRTVTWRWYLPAENRLQAELGLSRIADLADGAVYAIPPALR